jgi:hypothetical protein
MASTLFSDPLYTQQYNTAMGMLDPSSPQRTKEQDIAGAAVRKRYAQAGLTGSGQELQAIGDTAKDLTFNQSVEAMKASDMPIQNWLAAEKLRQAQKTGNIGLMSEALASLGIPAAAAKYLFGIDTTPKYVMPGATAPQADYGAIGNWIKGLSGPGDGAMAGTLSNVAPGVAPGMMPGAAEGVAASMPSGIDLSALLPTGGQVPDFSSAYDLMAGLF